jgi:GLEYA domain
VKGNGFADTEGMNVLIDDVQCKVFQSDLFHFKCETGPKALPAVPPKNYVGQHGLRRKYYNTTYELNMTSILTSPDGKELLAMDLESPKNLKDGFAGNTYAGYFKPPATGRYRFYVSCDDTCALYLGNRSMDASSKQKIFESPGWVNYRQYITIDWKRRTDWITLTQGEYYPLELIHV